MASNAISWPHAPTHRLAANGTYMVTAGTYGKEHYFRSPRKLDLLQEQLIITAARFGWELEAWALFSNHYHFIGHASPDGNSAESLRGFLRDLHSGTARLINLEDRTPNRKVWYNFWETALTFEKSYFARLNYTHQNAVRHGLVSEANQYPWCSAAWFERTAKPGQVKAIYSFDEKRVRLPFEFEPVQPED
jgi:putative transposase